MSKDELKELIQQLLDLRQANPKAHRALTLGAAALDAKYCDCGRERFGQCSVCDWDGE